MVTEILNNIAILSQKRQEQVSYFNVPRMAAMLGVVSGRGSRAGSNLVLRITNIC